MISTAPDAPWHTLDVEQVSRLLATDPRNGLAAAEAAGRLQRHGHNRLPAPPRRPAWLRFLAQFNNVLIFVMVGAGVITALLQHWVDTGVLLGAVVLNALVGFIQEGKAEDALDAIRHMLSSRATVVRDAQQLSVAADTLVPGDVVLLAAGDKVPADLRIVTAKSLRADEALLTGESVAVDKTAPPVAGDVPLGDRRCMLYSGSLVTAGQAAGIVVATGRATELGRISTLLEEVETVTTPLVRQMARFSRWLAATILLLAALTFILGIVWRSHTPADMFVMVVALAASAIPEGLPAILTITLAIGVQRMARRHAIIRKLPAVETLGAVSTVCSDKTGTLTRNEMAVQRLVTAARIFEVTGTGYGPLGDFRTDGRIVSAAAQPLLAECCRVAALCNDASLREEDGSWSVIGDPTEGALLALAAKAGASAASLRGIYPRIDVIPFESEHRFMATLHRDGAGAVIFIKGAPERVLEMCERQRGASVDEPLDPDYWRRQAVDSAARGMRLLSLACKRVEPTVAHLGHDDIKSGCTLLGLLGIIDPPRDEAVAAVADCRAAGVRVKMITGDHVETARAIGSALGIGQGQPALTGAEIEVLDAAALRSVVREIDVYARTSPEHKLRLVEALQHGGAVVAMTGDGVNDAPALKRADIGIAMGRKGTDAAKDAADMVLTDDNFATIANAIREGRGVYDNIRKFVLFMLPTNGGEALVVIAAILFDLVLPLTAAQVLWINLVTSATLGVALAFEPTEPAVMRRPPRDPHTGLLTRFFVWRVIMVSLLMMAAALGLFLWEIEHGSSVERARTIAVNAVVMCEMAYLINSRSIRGSMLHRRLFAGNRYVPLTIACCIVLQLAFVYAPFMHGIFNSTPLTPVDWLRVAIAGVLLFLAAELEKAVHRWLQARRRPAWMHAGEPAAISWPEAGAIGNSAESHSSSA